MIYELFIVACLMVYWPTLVLIGLYANYSHNLRVAPTERVRLMTMIGMIWHGFIAIMLLIITLGLVLAWRSFV